MDVKNILISFSIRKIFAHNVLGVIELPIEEELIV